MPRYELMLLWAQLAWVVFVVAVGACVGSLTNVLVYRMPLGLDVVVPSSRCPKCDTKLRWRENIPILGWLSLAGRCRYCKSAISPEYPIVETVAACLFGLFFVLWYVVPGNVVALGVPWGEIRPEWAIQDVMSSFPRHTWPEFIMLMTMIGCLLAMTLIDARTCMIPLSLAWIAAAAGLIVHTGHALAIQLGIAPWRLERFSDHAWVIPAAESWRVVLASIGGFVGLFVSLLLQRLGVIGQSFGDYETWVRAHIGGLRETCTKCGHDMRELAAEATNCPSCGHRRPDDPDAEESLDEEASGNPPWFGFFMGLGITFVLAIIGCAVAPSVGQPSWLGLLVGTIAGPLMSAAYFGFVVNRGRERVETPEEAELWIQYPHARREMVREMAFLGVPALLVAAGWFIGSSIQGSPPLVLEAGGGAILGFLVGGGVVWAVRILGSIAFGKEAMGIGDVHLMAGVGACIGWIDATLAFFAAAFVGIYWTILTVLASGAGPVRRTMPYGPYLAAASLLVLLAKPAIEVGLTLLMQYPPDRPPLDLP